MDLSIKQQFLDVVLIRKGSEPWPLAMPDGFEEMAAYNLLTFKSHQEALDSWALRELVGHHVNYRKQSSPLMQQLLPESDYRMFAVCARFPQNLVQQGITLQRVREGVFDIPVLGESIRVIVVTQLPQEEQNAMLHMFSNRADLIRYSREHYRPNDPESSTVLLRVLWGIEEDMNSTEELKQFARETIAEILKRMPPEKRMELVNSLPAEERIKGLPAAERIKGLPAEDRIKGLTAEELARVLPPEVVEALRNLPTKGAS